MAVNLSITVNGTPTYNSGNAKFGSYGLSGGAIAGDNADSFLSSTGANGGALTTGTVELWVKATNAGTLKVMASHAGWWYLAMDASGKPYFEYGWNAGTNMAMTGTTTIGDGAWHHVAMTLVNGAGSLYVDGVLQGSSSVTRNAVGMAGDSTNRFVLGNHLNNPSAFMWPGSIDEVRVSNVARYTGSTYTVPTAAFTPDANTVGLYHLENNGTADTSGALRTLSSALSGSATLTSALRRNIASPFSGSGTLSSKLSRNIASNLSGSATLSSSLRRTINSQFSGSASLASVLGKSIHADYSGTVTLTSSLVYTRRIASALSGSVTLTSTLTYLSGNHIASKFYVSGTLASKLKASPRFTSVLGGSEVVLYSELEYIVQPQPLEELPLGKLVRYTVNNFAVPLNPADGSGSTPSVNATYIKGKNPEFALGENFTVDNGAVGRYTGEIVRLSLNKKSDVATISTDTLLTKANVEMHLYPFIDADPGLWTAARAIDYWTQQCGVLFDDVDGEVSVYASGYGHANGYALGIADSHFYDKVTTGAVSTSVVNGRTVTSFGSAATTVMAQHEAKKTRVPVTVTTHRKMVFSFGVGIRGAGRTANVTYNFVDGGDHPYEVHLTATSAGVMTAYVNGVAVNTVSAPGAGNYRVAFSIQRVSPTAMVGKLTVHSDDLDGHGVLLANSLSKAFSSTLPGTLFLTSLTHSAAGGSGAEMLRWGTALSVAKYHPMTLPAVQKELGQSKKPLAYVSGFSGNVWKMLNEFCSINRLDVSFLGDRIVLGPRANGFSGSVKFSDFTVDSERREKYKQVAVVNKRSKAVTTGDAVFWRADSVFQVAAREVFETTVQTGHSILSLSQPVAVNGIEPFPYKQGTGQYVVTGADGYIIAPEWWYDNGGKVEVSMTEREGEIAIKITAPELDTVRAPYRISEGAGDRPALYVSGSGIMNDPTELHIATGAKNAREGFDNVFDSPFIATTADAYNTAVRMALQYSAAMAEVAFDVDNEFGVPSDLGTYPAGTVFTDNERNYKITDANQTHSKTTGNAIPFTSIAAYNASFPEGATIRDEKARHAGRTIKQVNIKPLRSNDE